MKRLVSVGLAIALGTAVLAWTGGWAAFRSAAQTPGALADAWETLASEDAARGYQAMWQFAQHPDAIQWFDKQLAPIEAPDLDKIQNWVIDLSSVKFAVREKASLELGKQGELAEPILRKALAAPPDLETKKRVELLLEKLERSILPPEKLRMLRAVEVLEMLGTPEATKLLTRLAKGFPGHRLTRESQESVQRLAHRGPVPEQWLTWAKGTPRPEAEEDQLPLAARMRLGSTQFRHTSQAVQTFFSPDSCTIISRTMKVIYVWEAKTGKRQRLFDLVTECIAVSPKGTILAASLRKGKKENGVVALWDWQAGKEISRVQLPAGVWASELLFSNDGTRLMCSGSDLTFRVWDATSLQELKKWKPASNASTLQGISPDGRRILANSRPDSYLLDVQTETKLPLQGPKRDPFLAVFSGNGKYVALRTSGKGPEIWGAATGKLLWQPSSEVIRLVSSVCFSPDDKIVAAGGNEAEISLWETASGKYLKTLAGSKGLKVGSISSDGRWLATTGDYAVRLWNLETGKAVDMGEGHSHRIERLQFSPRFDMLATVASNSLVLWDVVGGKQKRMLQTGGSDTGLAISPDGKWLATSDDAVSLWDMATGRQVFKLAGHETIGGPVALEFSPDSRYLMSWGVGDFFVRKWDVKTGKALVEKRTRPRGLDMPKDDDSSILDIEHFEFHMDSAFLPAANQFLLLSRAGNLHFFDVDTGKETRIIKVDTDEFAERLGVARSGKHFAIKGLRSPLTVYDSASGKRSYSIPMPLGIGDVVFSPDGRSVATANFDTLVLVEIATGKIRVQCPQRTQHLAFSPDGRFIALASPDSTAEILDLSKLTANAERK